MAFTRTIEFRECLGGKTWVTGGTWDGTAVTTGELDVQLKYVYTCILGCTGNGVQANAPSVDETLPGAGNALPGVLTIDFDSGSAGSWVAYGRV